MNSNFTKKRTCGIDEAGRGPIAGSLVVAAVILNSSIDGLIDSKKLTEKKRESLYPNIISNADYHIVSFSAGEIDEWGISACMKKALVEIKEYFDDCSFLFDGNTSFGVDDIPTMVKADTKIPEVSAASILAKVTHDREMIEYAKTYPQYGFEKHKGYGTKSHIEAIQKHGRCKAHRYSFKIKSLDEY